QGDTTYLIDGWLGFSGTTTIEGGAVLKYADFSGLDLLGPLICKTGPYRPAVFTSANDDTVGETISGSSGDPGDGGNYELILEGNTNAIKNLRFRYAGPNWPGISLHSPQSIEIS